jgi:hypothetical protein
MVGFVPAWRHTPEGTGVEVQGQSRQSYQETLSQEQVKSKRPGDMTQVVEHLTSKHN